VVGSVAIVLDKTVQCVQALPARAVHLAPTLLLLLLIRLLLLPRFNTAVRA
jgi:hypothetical protein